ncbi:MAG: hypothetical protein AB1700_00250 [Bacillota bacterium]
MVYLQSFFSEPKAEPYSVARWQPKGYDYPCIQVLAPFDECSWPIRKVPQDEYLELYAAGLRSRRLEVELAVGFLRDRDATLCCWCSPERQKGYPKLFCHTVLIGFLLESRGVPVCYLDGREKPVWDGEDKEKFLSLVGF